MKEGHEEENVRRDFLKFTAQQIKSDLILHHPAVLDRFKSTQSDRSYQFWERRPYSSTMVSRMAVEQKLDYMHNNPLQEKWKLVNLPEEYCFSSAKYYLFNDPLFSFITHYTEHI